MIVSCPSILLLYIVLCVSIVVLFYYSLFTCTNMLFLVIIYYTLYFWHFLSRLFELRFVYTLRSPNLTIPLCESTLINFESLLFFKKYKFMGQVSYLKKIEITFKILNPIFLKNLVLEIEVEILCKFHKQHIWFKSDSQILCPIAYFISEIKLLALRFYFLLLREH